MELGDTNTESQRQQGQFLQAGQEAMCQGANQGPAREVVGEAPQVVPALAAPALPAKIPLGAKPPAPPPHHVRTHHRSRTVLFGGQRVGNPGLPEPFLNEQQRNGSKPVFPASPNHSRNRSRHRRFKSIDSGSSPISRSASPYVQHERQRFYSGLDNSQVDVGAVDRDGEPGPEIDEEADEGLAQLSDALLILGGPGALPAPKMSGTNNSFPSLDSPISSNNRGGASPTTTHTGGQSNGNGMGNSANYMAPLPVGHQQDLNFLYAQIQELSAILKSNREKANSLTKAAEEVARRANTNGTHSEGEENRGDSEARIRELEHQVAKANYTISLYKHEQTENTNLIAMYEDALGNATEGIRNYCLGIEERFLGQRRHYNNLLQAEKDEHLQSRLDRDHWNAETLKVCEMIRTAHRLRVDEWGEEYTIIAGLQSEVRCLRRCLGMDAERPEDETGWPYLKDAPLNDTS